MRIHNLDAYQLSDGTYTIALRIDTGHSLIREAIASIFALFPDSHVKPAISTPVPAPVGVLVTQPTVEEAIDTIEAVIKEDTELLKALADAPAEPAAKADAPTSRTRRPRAAAPAVTPAWAEDAMQQQAVEEAIDTAKAPRARRTPVTAPAEPEAPAVKTITDADLAKACTNAAAIIGPDVVKAVVADFHVAAINLLAADVREKFLAELEDEIRLAKEEMASAGK